MGRISYDGGVCISVTELILVLDTLSFMLKHEIEWLKIDFHIRLYISDLAVIFNYLWIDQTVKSLRNSNDLKPLCHYL